MYYSPLLLFLVVTLGVIQRMPMHFKLFSRWLNIMTTAEQRRVFLRAHHPCPLLLQLTALHGFLQGSTLSSDVSELMAADLALKPCKTLNNISKLIKWTWHKIQNSTSTKPSRHWDLYDHPYQRSGEQEQMQAEGVRRVLQSDASSARLLVVSPALHLPARWSHRNCQERCRELTLWVPKNSPNDQPMSLLLVFPGEWCECAGPWAFFGWFGQLQWWSPEEHCAQCALVLGIPNTSITVVPAGLLCCRKIRYNSSDVWHWLKLQQGLKSLKWSAFRRAPEPSRASCWIHTSLWATCKDTLLVSLNRLVRNMEKHTNNQQYDFCDSSPTHSDPWQLLASFGGSEQLVGQLISFNHLQQPTNCFKGTIHTASARPSMFGGRKGLWRPCHHVPRNMDRARNNLLLG